MVSPLDLRQELGRLSMDVLGLAVSSWCPSTIGIGLMTSWPGSRARSAVGSRRSARSRRRPVLFSEMTSGPGAYPRTEDIAAPAATLSAKELPPTASSKWPASRRMSTPESGARRLVGLAGTKQRMGDAGRVRGPASCGDVTA